MNREFMYTLTLPVQLTYQILRFMSKLIQIFIKLNLNVTFVYFFYQ